MPEISIELPLPPRKLQTNRQGSLHWGSKGKLVKKARWDANIAARSQIMRSRTPGLIDGQLWGRVLITPAFFFRTSHKRDHDNLIAWLKAYIDGLQGVVFEDDAGVNWAVPTVHSGTKDELVILHIEQKP